MRKLVLILALFLTGVSFAFAAKETPEQKKANDIKGDPENYIFGVGFGEDPEEAYNAALHDMVRKISINVKADTHIESTDRLNADGTTTTEEQFKSVIDSYTTPAALEDVQVIAIGDAPDFERFVYMPKANVEKMHKRRRNNVADLARSGIRARDKGKVDDALRHLYRSYVLLQSLPAPSEVIENVDGEPRVLANWLPEAMRDIVNKVTFGVASVKQDEDDPENGGKTVELNVRYDGKPATTCTFKYGTASGYSSLITARDGLAMIELSPNVPMNPLKLYVEYLFKNENHANAELKPLLDSFKGAGLVQNQYLLNDSKKELKADKKEAKAFQEQVAAGAHEGILEMNREEVSPYVGLMEMIIWAINNKKYDEVKDICTPEGWMMFERLMKYGKVRILGKATRDTYEFYPYRDEVMCRSVPMSFTFSKGRQFTEDVTFTFNQDRKLVSLGFGLGSIARKDIFAKEGAAWTDDKKMVLVNFLENYRTAFALGMQDYIESIFDDDAVIIVGHVTKKLEKVPGAEGFGLAEKEHVVYTQKTKKEYMEQLRRCFAS
ncbi:MAG: hypothetical protein K2K32_03960, partial [Muribaculaceae bacterium]|nr:hypothetical protein [Muribaculaceae bacterium]